MEKVSLHAFQLGLSLALSRIHMSSMYCCYNPLALVRFPTEPWTHHHQLSWTTLTSGKFIGSWTAGLIIVARGQDFCTLSSGKDSTTPPMPQVGNHQNTL